MIRDYGRESKRAAQEGNAGNKSKVPEMTPCPKEIEEKVLQLPDGTLSPEEEERVMDHVEKCESCKLLLDMVLIADTQNGRKP